MSNIIIKQQAIGRSIDIDQSFEAQKNRLIEGIKVKDLMMVKLTLGFLKRLGKEKDAMPLHFCALFGDEKIMEYLLNDEHKLSLDQRDGNSRRPIYYVWPNKRDIKSKIGIVKLLKEKAIKENKGTSEYDELLGYLQDEHKLYYEPLRLEGRIIEYRYTTTCRAELKRAMDVKTDQKRSKELFEHEVRRMMKVFDVECIKDLFKTNKELMEMLFFVNGRIVNYLSRDEDKVMWDYTGRRPWLESSYEKELYEALSRDSSKDGGVHIIPYRTANVKYFKHMIAETLEKNLGAQAQRLQRLSPYWVSPTTARRGVKTRNLFRDVFLYRLQACAQLKDRVRVAYDCDGLTGFKAQVDALKYLNTEEQFSVIVDPVFTEKPHHWRLVVGVFDHTKGDLMCVILINSCTSKAGIKLVKEMLSKEGIEAPLLDCSTNIQWQDFDYNCGLYTFLHGKAFLAMIRYEEFFKELKGYSYFENLEKFPIVKKRLEGWIKGAIKSAG